jgi:hypothetical protein
MRSLRLYLFFASSSGRGGTVLLVFIECPEGADIVTEEDTIYSAPFILMRVATKGP